MDLTPAMRRTLDTKNCSYILRRHPAQMLDGPLDATHHHAQIRVALERIGKSTGRMGLLIAAPALALDSVVITSNA